MKASFIPRLSLESASPFQLAGQVKQVRMSPDAEGPTFKDTLMNTLGSINEVTGAPDKLMKEAMTTGRVDVHEVMIANAEAELLLNVTTQMATKVVQAYDKILQIQI